MVQADMFDNAGWTEQAAMFLRSYARNARFFVIEDARAAAAEVVALPSDARAWGHAARYAARRGWIRRAGYAPTHSSHGSPKCLWSA